MKISVQKTDIGLVDKDIDVTTVCLIRNNSNQYKMFHCVDCGIYVIQYKGDVVSVMPGGAPSELPILVICPRKDCYKRYMFVSILTRDL